MTVGRQDYCQSLVCCGSASPALLGSMFKIIAKLKELPENYSVFHLFESLFSSVAVTTKVFVRWCQLVTKT